MFNCLIGHNLLMMIALAKSFKEKEMKTILSISACVLLIVANPAFAGGTKAEAKAQAKAQFELARKQSKAAKQQLKQVKREQAKAKIEARAKTQDKDQ